MLVTSVDQLPSLTPDITAASVQTTVAEIFDAMNREQLSIVGIVATDERDVTYLAGSFVERPPMCSSSFLVSTCCTLNSDFAPYTRGSLVVSSYPLSSSIQQWMSDGNGSRQFRQFQSTASEGIYNATLALMANSSLMDYATAETATASGPPVWVSAVGKHNFVPLMFHTGGSPTYEYPLKGHRGTPTYPHQTQPVSLMLRTLVCLFGFAVAWHVLAIAKQLSPTFFARGVDVGLSKALSRARYLRAETEYQVAKLPLDERWNALIRTGRKNWVDELAELRFRDGFRVFALPMQPRARRRTSHALIYAAFGLLGLSMTRVLSVISMVFGQIPGTAVAVAGLTLALLPPTFLFATDWSLPIKTHDTVDTSVDNEHSMTWTPEVNTSYGFVFAMILALAIGAVHLISLWIPPFAFTSYWNRSPHRRSCMEIATSRLTASCRHQFRSFCLPWRYMSGSVGNWTVSRKAAMVIGAYSPPDVHLPMTQRRSRRP